MTANLDIDGHRNILRFERVLRQDRDRVWRAVTDPAELREWFPTAVDYEPRVGAAMRFDFGGKHDLDPMHGEVLEWRPQDAFAFTWGEDTLRFELSETDEGTLLVFTHSFTHEPGKAGRDAAGWAACFEAFDALLGDAPPPDADAWRRHAEPLARKFGELTLDGHALLLTGPYKDVDGHAAVDVAIDGEPGTLVVSEAGRPLEDGVQAEVRGESGGTLATGALHDPLVPTSPR